MSVWNQFLFPTYDIAIIGGGFTGLNTALYLKKKQPNWEILVIEKQAVGALASTNNAGFACFGSASEIYHDLQNHPREEVVALISRRFRGIEKLAKIPNIDQAFEGGFDVFTPSEKEEFDLIDQNLDVINEVVFDAIGKKMVFKKVCINHFNTGFFPEGFKNELEFQINPGLLHQHLTKHCVRAGIRMMNGVEVRNFQSDAIKVNIETNIGSLEVNTLALCTNALTNSILPSAIVQPARGQILLTSALNFNPINGNFHGTQGYYYFRNLGDRILFGGGRQINMKGETTTEAVVTHEIQQHLEQYLSTYILPNQPFSIDKRWAGIMGMGQSKMPEVKQIEPLVFGAFAFGGMGVALSDTAAFELSELITLNA